jgi:hypothetical protein
MSKAAFCAYGAAQTMTAVQQLESAALPAQVITLSTLRLPPPHFIGREQGAEGLRPSPDFAPPPAGSPSGQGQLNSSVEEWRRSAVQLQACLTLFAPCFPPTRLAFWKRRLRRLIRALNALHDHQHLLRLIPKGRVRLRLQQRVEMLLSKAHRAWQRIQSDHVLNEIRGLSQRLYVPRPRGTTGGLGSTLLPAPTEIAGYARARWHELSRVNLKSLESGGQSVEVRWGRLQLMLMVAQMLAPLLPNEIPLAELQTRYQQLDVERFHERARALLIELKEQERQLTLHYHGSLRGFQRIEREFDKWIAQFQSLSSQRHSSEGIR